LEEVELFQAAKSKKRAARLIIRLRKDMRK